MKLRNLIILFVIQGISLSTISMAILISNIVSTQYFSYKILATLPITCVVMGAMIFSNFASLLLKKFGLKKGFIFGNINGIIALFVVVLGMLLLNFFIFCFGHLLIGVSLSFIRRYRFAAVEMVDKSMAGHAISFIILGSIFSGFFGPQFGKIFREVFFFPPFVGSYLFATLFFIVSILFLCFFDEKSKINNRVEHAHEMRSIWIILSQNHMILSILVASSAYFFMAFVMASTSISMHLIDGFSLSQTTYVIQAHILAMFLPSLFTGFLVRKFGAINLILLGILGFVLSALTLIFFSSFFGYLVGLILLGSAWNWCYVSSTLLLTTKYYESEKHIVQGINDTFVFFGQGLGTLTSAIVLYSIGWKVMNVIVFLCVVIVFCLVVFLRKDDV